MLATPVALDGGHVCRSYDEQMRFLEEHVEDLVQPVGAYLHGDVHLPNMLLDGSGQEVLFIDPRTVWDGNDVGDPGWGDPMYDYATLLHSLHYMSAILRAIDEGYAERLLIVEEGAPLGGGPGLAVSPGWLRITESPTVDWFTGWMERQLPPKVLGPNWRARLHVGTANATLGWLKYARSVKTRHAWIAVFAGVLYHLEAARRLLEEGRER